MKIIDRIVTNVATMSLVYRVAGLAALTLSVLVLAVALGRVL